MKIVMLLGMKLLGIGVLLKKNTLAYVSTCLQQYEVILIDELLDEVQINNRIFKPSVMNKELFFGFIQKPFGRVAEPEKAILDFIYLHGDIDHDQINWDLINDEKYKKYFNKFPESFKYKQCH